MSTVDEKNTVNICGKRTLEYITECLGKFNRGSEKVTIRAFGGNISKGVRTAQILSSEFRDIKIYSTDIQDMKIYFTDTKQSEKDEPQDSLLEIVLINNQSKQHITNYSKEDIIQVNRSLYDENAFVNFPIYHLLLDSLLYKEKRIDISYYPRGIKNESKKLISIVDSAGDMYCESKLSSDDRELHNKLASAYYRSGLLVSADCEKIAKRLAEYDDIIIGIDTNMLQDAALSEQILSSLSIINVTEYVHTPNWMLIVIPSAVMHEIEQASNSRNERGFLKDQGRMGFRALQEILELGQSADLIGVSVIIFGGANPVLDSRIELSGLREDLLRFAKAGTAESLPSPSPSPKKSSGDTVIRDQFKLFLRQLDFYKGGVFFLTADKTNAALAQAEGLFSIYYKSPIFREAEGKVGLHEIDYKRGTRKEKISIPVPLGKLIYELAIQFGTINISWNKDKYGVDISPDAKGEFLDHWMYRDLMIKDFQDREKLLEYYNQVGKLHLIYVKDVWGKICEALTKTKFI